MNLCRSGKSVTNLKPGVWHIRCDYLQMDKAAFEGEEISAKNYKAMQKRIAK